MAKTETRNVGKCECGGQVRGIEQMGQIFSWCEKCSPVVVFKLGRKK